jgi:hypothetical protein
LFINLTPFIPLSFQQERGRRRKRGAKPLRAGGWERRDKLKTWGDGVNSKGY